jgi:hypothetical protein
VALLFGCSINCHKDAPLSVFRDDQSGLIGFKDQNGRIRIDAAYTNFTTVRKFDKIVAVMKENNETYYLTKCGKKFGINSVYFFDNGPDCESEGFIRFRDNKTDKVGMFNGEGEIVIPAEYDDLSGVNNGLVIALKGAKKQYPHGNNPSGCNHFSWVGGEKYLIDTHHRIIINNFKNESLLNLFSLQTGQEPEKDANRESFLGVDGRYYSFIDYQKEFQEWLNALLLHFPSKEKMKEYSYHEIYFWKEPEGWTAEASSKFIHKNYELLKGKLEVLRKKNTEHFISIDGLNPFIYKTAEFDRYYNNCDEPKEWQYPVMSVVINRKTKNDFDQDIFEFLRTENGYKLISVTIRSEKLK